MLFSFLVYNTVIATLNNNQWNVYVCIITTTVIEPDGIVYSTSASAVFGIVRAFIGVVWNTKVHI